MFTLAQLKARGWSDGLIRDLLGEPDQQRRNPHYRSGAPMRLYDCARVEAAEAHERFLKHKAKRHGLSRRAKAAADAQREALLNEIRQITFNVPRLPLEEVYTRSLAAWEEFQMVRGRDGSGVGADPETRKRWALNWLRHEATNYDSRLSALYGRVGKTAAYWLVKEAVKRAIIEVYPELK